MDTILQLPNLMAKIMPHPAYLQALVSRDYLECYVNIFKSRTTSIRSLFSSVNTIKIGMAAGLEVTDDILDTCAPYATVEVLEFLQESEWEMPIMLRMSAAATGNLPVVIWAKECGFS